MSILLKEKFTEFTVEFVNVQFRMNKNKLRVSLNPTSSSLGFHVTERWDFLKMQDFFQWCMQAKVSFRWLLMKRRDDVSDFNRTISIADLACLSLEKYNHNPKAYKYCKQVPLAWT